jgi:hypothetical protein
MFFSLPFLGVPLYEMLMEIGVEVFVAMLMGLELMMGIGIGGADRTGASGSGFLIYFFQMSVPIMKIASAIRIITAGGVKV